VIRGEVSAPTDHDIEPGGHSTAVTSTFRHGQLNQFIS
jgi:hypothetical protein